MFVKQKLHLGRPGVQGKCREGRGFGGWVVGPGQESTGTIFVPKHFFQNIFYPGMGPVHSQAGGMEKTRRVGGPSTEGGGASIEARGPPTPDGDNDFDRT